MYCLTPNLSHVFQELLSVYLWSSLLLQVLNLHLKIIKLLQIICDFCDYVYILWIKDAAFKRVSPRKGSSKESTW